ARPAANRFFPNPIPFGVYLWVRNQIITTFQVVSPTELRFRLPASAVGGPVYLRALGPPVTSASQALARSCGRAFPGIPDAILFGGPPAAFLTILSPPVVTLTVDGQSPPADGLVAKEACRAVDIDWAVRFPDQALGDLPPCAALEVSLEQDG